MSCSVKVSKHGTVSVVEVKGELAGADSNKLSHKVTELLERDSGTIALDFSQTAYLDSPGLGICIFAWKQAHDQGRELVIVNPSPFVLETLERTNLDRQIRIIQSLGEI